MNADGLIKRQTIECSCIWNHSIIWVSYSDHILEYLSYIKLTLQVILYTHVRLFIAHQSSVNVSAAGI